MRAQLNSGDREKGTNVIQFKCEHCEAAFKVPDEKAGKSGKCPKCGQVIHIPAVTSAQSPATGDPVGEASAPRIAQAAQPAAPAHEAEGPSPAIRALGWGMAVIACLIALGLALGVLALLTNRAETPWQVWAGLAVNCLMVLLAFLAWRQAIVGDSAWKVTVGAYLGLQVLHAGALFVLRGQLPPGFRTMFPTVGASLAVLSVLIGAGGYLFVLSRSRSSPARAGAGTPVLGVVLALLHLGGLYTGDLAIFAGARASARAAVCKYNMHMIGKGLGLYCAFYNRVPLRLSDLVQSRDISPGVLLACPSDQQPFVYVLDYLRDRYVREEGVSPDQAHKTVHPNILHLPAKSPLLWDAQQSHVEGTVYFLNSAGAVDQLPQAEFREALDRAYSFVSRRNR